VPPARAKSGCGTPPRLRREGRDASTTGNHRRRLEVNDLAALLRAIRERPADRELRLVFADWLDEHGEPARAELIRVQLPLYGMPDSDARKPALQKREKALLQEHRSAWLGILASMEAESMSPTGIRSRKARDGVFSFVRGLPVVRFGPDANPTPDLLEAPQWDWVTEVGWASGWRAANVIGFLDAPRLAGVTHLQLSGIKSGRSSRKEVAELAASPRLARLTALDLTDNKIDTEGATALAMSPHLAQLTSFDLTYNLIGDEGARALTASPHLTNMTNLQLRRIGIGATGATALAASPLLAHLSKLQLSENDIGDEGARTLAACPDLARLATLDLFSCGIADAGGRALATSAYLGQLASLALRWNKFSDEVVQALRARFGERVWM
jgi:uncharacterized protein (TIGR02996 family)